MKYEAKRMTELEDGKMKSDKVMIKKISAHGPSEYLFVEVEHLPELLKTLQDVNTEPLC